MSNKQSKKKHLPKFVITTSTSGSVMNEALKVSYFRKLIHSVVADRDCKAIEKAKKHGIPVKVFAGGTRERFCSQLLKYLKENEIDYVISHYMKTYTPEIQRAYRDRIVNLHLALLPSFKGYDGFNDGVRYGVKFVGSTVELVDKRMDEGKIVLQACCPLDPNDIEGVRHKVFVQQVKCEVQVARWLVEGRVQVDGRMVSIAGARFDDPHFSPALDFEGALSIDIPRSGT